MKIVTVVGARPQFVKAAVVGKELSTRSGVQECLIHTGQHFDNNMSDLFFDELDIPRPKHSMNVHSLPHGAMTGRMLEAVEEILIHEQPDGVLVYGDTNSTLAGALAAAKLHIPVAHVEAGLRSFNKRMPEEINRIATDHISDLLFAPTTVAHQNLVDEGISGSNVVNSGDVMFDCARQYGAIAQSRSQILDSINLTDKSFMLCTAHRAETTASRRLMSVLFEAIEKIAGELPVVMPIHPATNQQARGFGIDLSKISGLKTIDPVGYLDMIRLEQAAALILTDSGGVQKEAYFHRVPCVTIRPQTEWTELVTAGWNKLCPLEDGAQAVFDTVQAQFGAIGKTVHEYGEGHAAEIIVDSLVGMLTDRVRSN